MLGPNCKRGCCNSKIGYDWYWYTVDSCFGFNYLGPLTVPFLANDISRISRCRLVFAGLVGNLQFDGVYFNESDWGAIRSYIEGGGRLYLQGASSGFMWNPVWQQRFNAFLAALGTSIRWVGGSYDNGSCVPTTAGPANIAQGNIPNVPPYVINVPLQVFVNATAELSGGTNVWLSQSGKKAVQVERLGDGFLFVSGTTGLFNFNGGVSSSACNNCAFMRRLYYYDDGEII